MTTELKIRGRVLESKCIIIPRGNIKLRTEEKEMEKMGKRGKRINIQTKILK